MKKNFFLLSFMFLTVTAFSQPNAEELARDRCFIEYITATNQMAETLLTRFTKDELVSVRQAIESKQKENLSSEEQNAQVCEIIKCKDPKEFIIFSDALIKNAGCIREKYGNIPDDVFQNAGATVLQNSAGRAFDCGWRFGWCAAYVAARGLIMVGACEGVTVGLGTPGCVAGVALWTAHEIGECRDKHCK